MSASRTLLAGPAAFLCLVALLALGPTYLSPYDLTVGFTLLTYAGLAQAWNIVGGLGGQFSLGHSAFVGSGGYGTAVLLLHTGLPLGLVLPLAGLISAAIAVIVGVALFRLRGVYFSVGSLAVALAATAWMVNWDYTGANQGLNLPFDAIPTQEALYELALVAVALPTAIAWLLRRTTWGLRVQAVRDDEDAAVLAGVATGRLKIATLAVSAFCTGLVGGLIALQQISINPEAMFSLDWTVRMIVMTVIGGIGTVAGPLVGATVVYYAIEKQLEDHAQVSQLITGVLLLAVVRFFPGGLLQGARLTFERVAATTRGLRDARNPKGGGVIS
jgi:branched-chain amino acid transport system permease protein